MALLDIDKILLKKTIKGINCLECGGSLKEIENKTMTGKIIKAATIGLLKTKQYECETCGRKYILL
jgi:YgiT-type zinc finger domain-containing protein